MLFLWRKQTDRRFEGKRVGRGSRVSFKSFDKTFLLVLRLPKLTLFLIPQIFFSSSYYYFFFPSGLVMTLATIWLSFLFSFARHDLLASTWVLKVQKMATRATKIFKTQKWIIWLLKFELESQNVCLVSSDHVLLAFFFFNHLQGRHKKKKPTRLMVDLKINSTSKKKKIK